MSSSKTHGNLRDFRIDHQSDRGLETPASAPRRETPIITPAPKQSVKSRMQPAAQAPQPARKMAPLSSPVEKSTQKPASSMAEWAVENEENPWSSWEKDAGTEIELSARVPQPSAPMRNSYENSAPSQSSAASTGLWTSSPHSEASGADAIDAPVETLAQTLKSEDPGRHPWSVELALSERRAHRMGVVDFANAYQKQELLKIRTQEFTATLQNTFREHVELFNETRRSPAHAIQLYKVSQTAEDFMLFRNGVKLVVSGQRSGRVLLAFNQYLGQIFAPTSSPTVEIEASWGAFDQLFWQYKGERVQVLDLVRYFMTEFVRQSFK